MLTLILLSSLCLTGLTSQTSSMSANTQSRHRLPSHSVFFTDNGMDTTEMDITEVANHQENSEDLFSDISTEAFPALDRETGRKGQSVPKTVCGSPHSASSTAIPTADFSGVTEVSLNQTHWKLVGSVALVSSNQTRWKLDSFQRVWFHETSATEPTNDRYLHTTTLSIMTTEPQEEDDPFSQELISPEAYINSVVPLERLTLFFRILAFGINLLNAVVLSQKSMHSPATPFLIALAVAEFVYVFLGLIPPAYNTIMPLPQTSFFFITYALYVFNYVMVVLSRYTYCLTTIVCVGRFFALAFPLRASRSRLIKSPLVVIVACLLVLLLLHLDVPLRYEVYLAQPLASGEELYAFRITGVYAANTYFMVTWNLAIKVVFVYMMLFLSLVVNVLLVVVLQRHGRSRQDMITSDNTDKRKRQEREITVTILVSSTVFTLLGIPLATNAMASKIVPERYGFFSPRCHTYLFLQDVGGALFALSYCTDFFAFFLFNSAFRATLRQVLSRALRCVSVSADRSGSKDKMQATGTEVSSSVATKNNETAFAETTIG